MTSSNLRIISRASPLAVTQVEEALVALRPFLGEAAAGARRITLRTPGDRDLRTPLTDPGVTDDFFTRDLDEALVRGEADLAVHSAKDLPETLRPELVVAARLPARDIRDALVYRPGAAADEAPAVIGTSSPRRAEYLRRMFPDAELRPIRGTIGQRLEQLDEGRYDAVVIAACALERLGLAGRIGGYLDADPEPDQGRLAVTVRRSDTGLLRSLRRADVVRRAGLVVLVATPVPEQAGLYLRAADRVYCETGQCPGPPSPRLVEMEAGLTAIDRFQAVLREAEQGRMVVYAYPPGWNGAEGFLASFAAWGLRVLWIGPAGERTAGTQTLFVGTDPAPFLRHGPFLHLPLIECSPLPIGERRSALEAALAGVDGVLFPSRNALRFTLEALPAAAKALSERKLLGIGPATAAEMEARGLHVDYAPASFRGVRELAAALPDELRGTYLYPCSDAAPLEERAALLAPHGVRIVPCVIYTNRPVAPAPLPGEPFARVFFTSASTVRTYFERYPEERAAERDWIAVGPSTREALAARGLAADEA